MASRLIILPYPHLPASLNDYDPRAPEVARLVGELITARMADALVEHVGSTSVPGCAGKGVIDLLLIYPDGKLAEARDALAGLGFQRQTTRDPFPEERPMRTGAVEYGGTLFRAHVHVLAAGSPEIGEVRAFRDRLRADPRLVAAYVARKREIVESVTTDGVDYSIAKGSFVQQAMK